MKKIFSLIAAVLFAGSMMAATEMTCAEAAAAAKAGSTAEVIVKGYVTALEGNWNSQYKQVSFWIADAENGGKVLEAFRAKCEKATDAPAVGDYVQVTGKLAWYAAKSIAEIDANCTFEILQAGTPPVNLGEKTIEEFLALKNTKDTCVLTGVVANIVMDKDDKTKYNKYGNFDLVELDNDEVKVYIYGLLTADGKSGQFLNMDIDEGDTLTLKAVYTTYNNEPQAKNTVYVEHIKGGGGEDVPFVNPDWQFVSSSYIVYDVDGYIDLNLYTNETYYVEYGEEGNQVYGEGDGVVLTLDIVYEDLDDLTGVYKSEEMSLDVEYSGATTYVGESETTVTFASGTVTIEFNEGHTGYIVTYDLVDDKGNHYTGTAAADLYEDTEENIVNTKAAVETTKSLRNGILVIEKNGVRYNAVGQIVK